ncbi:MAG: hypothetical protein V4757_07180 [Pseudomonadota bacterium]
MDYQALLAKYMQLVINEESVSFLDCANHQWVPPGEVASFTREEMEELRRVEVVARAAAGRQ